MEKFYCNYCEEDVVLKNGKCPKCNTDWEKTVDTGKTVGIDGKIIDNELKKEHKQEVSFNHSITNADINDNIEFFMSWAM